MIEPTKEDIGRLVSCRRRLGPESWSTEVVETLRGFTGGQIFTMPIASPANSMGFLLGQSHCYDRRSGEDEVEWS